MKTRSIIIGALGRMGQEIARVIADDATCELVGAVEFPQHASIGKKYGDLLGIPAFDFPVVGSIDTLNVAGTVIINFALPASLAEFMTSIKGKDVRLVLGTTGLDSAMEQKIKDASAHIPTVFAPNFSLGINLLFHITKLVTEKLKADFDIEIIEAHHRFKKDAPSGTAKKIGEIVAETMGQKYDEVVRDGREGITGERTKTEIGMHAVRGGDIVGDHTVLFAGPGERVELRHMAHSRRPLAIGAVKAALWLASRPTGCYSMQDVLGLTSR